MAVAVSIAHGAPTGGTAVPEPGRGGAVEFYVAPGGSDANPGTVRRPFASLERARDAARALQSRAKPDASSRVVIWLRGGDYVRTNAFDLGPQDSGRDAAPVVWSGYPGERARLLGGRVLPSPRDTAMFDPGKPKTGGNDSATKAPWTAVTDPAVLERFDESVRPFVRQLNLAALGLGGFGEMKSRGFGRPTTPSHSELFFGGRPMELARWPNRGDSARIAGFPEKAGRGDDHGGKIGDLPGGFTYAGDRPLRWRDTGDIWVHGYWAWDWANSYERIASIDRTARWIQTAPPHGLYGFRAGQRFHFLNVLEELDQPGEWYLDRQAGRLYFWPPSRDEVAEAVAGRPEECLLSMLDHPLIRCTDVSFVVVRGLALEATRGNAVEIRGGESVSLAGCFLRNIGDYGVVVEGGRNHRVDGCDVLDTGDGGVSLSGGDRRTLVAGRHEVANSHFQRQGRWSKCYVPAVLMNGVGMVAANNLIHDHPHCAILFNGNDHQILRNEIHHIALESGDVGAIYTGRDYTYRGNEIRHNYIHETGGVGMGSMGVYMDDCVSGTTIFGNVFHRVHWAMFIGGGRDHRVENNVFVDCDPAIRMDGRGLDPSPVWHGMVFDYMKKQLEAVPLELYRQRYPAIRDVERYFADPKVAGIPPENNRVLRNVCSGKWLEAGWRSSEKDLELKDNLMAEDPGFVDRARLDFRLRDDSPAWRLGFQRIPVETIGLVDSVERRGLRVLRGDLR